MSTKSTNTIRSVTSIAPLILVGVLLAASVASRADTIYVSNVGNTVGLALDSGGNLYVANAGNSTIEKFTPNGVGSLFASTGLNVPVGLAFDSGGNLYAANFVGNTIEKFTPGGLGSLFATTGS